MGVTQFVKPHREESIEQLTRFLKTVFHTIDGVDQNNEHIFYSKHSEQPTANGAWPYSSIEQVTKGGEDNTYHFCTCSVKKKDPNDRVKRRRELFEGLHLVVLDDIGSKVSMNALKPTYKIETSEGNFQWGYVFTQPVKDLHVAQKLVHAIYNRPGLTDRGGAMVNKLVKLPLGKNLKEGRNNFEVKLIELNEGLTYSPSDLINAWSLTLDAKSLSTLKKKGEKVDLKDELLTWMADNGYIHGRESEEYYRVECPLGGDHSDGNTYAGYSPIGEGENPMKRHFHCFHGHDDTGGPPSTLEFLAFMATHKDCPKVGIDAPKEHFENEVGFHPMEDAIPSEHFPDIRFREDKPPVIKKTHRNVEYLIDRYGYSTCYDVISKKAIITHYKDDTLEADNHQNGMIYSIMSQCAQTEFNIGIDMLNGYLMQITLDKPWNPITEYLDQIDPDFEDPKYLKIAQKAYMGKGKFDPEKIDFKTLDFTRTLADTVELGEMSQVGMWRTFLHLWLIQCVAAADGAQRTPNPEAKAKFESVLTLAGRQGAQKTKWFNALMVEVMVEYFCDGALLNPADKDSMMLIMSNWVVELGELDATFKRALIAQIKSFLSQGKDRLRPPYARTVSEFKRRTSFCASVNDLQFLHDATGNRRFWPVEVEYLRQPSKELMTCVWWQVWREYLEGAQWWIDDPVLMAQVSVATEQFDAVHETPEIAELIATFGYMDLEAMTADDSVWLRTKQICDLAGIDTKNRMAMRNVSSYLLNRVPRGQEKLVKRKDRTNTYEYRVPKPKNRFSED